MNDPFRSKTGRLLRSLREKHRIPQAKLANFLDKDQSQISRIERGLEDLRFAEVSKLCHYFGISMVDFVAQVEYKYLLEEPGLMPSIGQHQGV